jgi:hypothetical protein
VGTFTVSGIHTLLWLPRAFQMRRELLAEQAALQLKNGDNGGATGPSSEDH